MVLAQVLGDDLFDFFGNIYLCFCKKSTCLRLRNSEKGESTKNSMLFGAKKLFGYREEEIPVVFYRKVRNN